MQVVSFVAITTGFARKKTTAKAVLFIIIAGVFRDISGGRQATDTVTAGQPLSDRVSAVLSDTSERVERNRSWLTAAGLSIALPGAGQIYTGRYVKAGTFFAAGLIAGLYTGERTDRLRYYLKTDPHWNDSIADAGDSFVVDSSGDRNDTIAVAVRYEESRELTRYDRQRDRYAVYQGVCWMGGIYLYNVMDALTDAGFLYSTGYRRPARAGWLSAVPALGLGQLYNGSFGKAGLLWMTNVSLGYVIYNNHRLMRRAEERYREVTTEGTVRYYWNEQEGYADSWKSRRDLAFRNRNMYLWYWLLFYFYGIFDAVVDAHLHDMPVKMRLEPDLTTGDQAIHLEANLGF